MRRGYNLCHRLTPPAPRHYEDGPMIDLQKARLQSEAETSTPLLPSLERGGASRSVCLAEV